ARSTLFPYTRLFRSALESSRHRWQGSAIAQSLGLDPGAGYAVLTLHRPSNVDDPRTLANLLEPLQMLSRHIPIIFPVHPRVRQRSEEHTSELQSHLN